MTNEPQQHPQVPDHVPAPEASEAETLGAPTPQTADGQIPDPEQWTTGGDPMTDAQRNYLDSLAKQAGEELPGDLTKAQASEQIDRLQGGRGGGGGQSW